jgi:hypothetical protein
MFTQSQIETLASLDAYFAETPQSVIVAEVEAIGALAFEGATAKDYFDLFSQHFNVELLRTSIHAPDFTDTEDVGINKPSKLKVA